MGHTDSDRTRCRIRPEPERTKVLSGFAASALLAANPKMDFIKRDSSAEGGLYGGFEMRGGKLRLQRGASVL